MPKQFYTEHDIEDLFRSGVKSLQVTDDVVLTELAYEKANRLGFQLITDRAHNPSGAPVRPYLSDANSTPRAKPTVAPVTQAVPEPQPTPSNSNDIEKRIRSAVTA